jgi:hypothetical protein
MRASCLAVGRRGREDGVAGVILEGNWGKSGEPQHLGDGPAHPDNEVPWHETTIHSGLGNTSERAVPLQPGAEPEPFRDEGSGERERDEARRARKSGERHGAGHAGE